MATRVDPSRIDPREVARLRAPGGQAPAVAWTAKPRVSSKVREGLVGTPGTMRVFNVVCMLAALVFGAVGALSINARSDALSDVQADAEQLVRVQSIRADLVQADADATNAYLKGGLDTPAQRSSYETGRADAARTIAAASAKSPADATALAEVNSTLATYSGLIESARANNRQGYPVGAAYLRQASELLRTEALAKLDKISLADQARVSAAYDSSKNALIPLLIVTGIALVPMLIAQGWLFFRTRRWVNMGMAVATLAVVGAAGGSSAVMAASESTADQVRTGSYAATVAASQARADLYDAKTQESFTLILRGSGEKKELRYQELVVDAEKQLTAVEKAAGPTTEVRKALTRYDEIHTVVRGLDDGGRWDDAVKLATSEATDDLPENQTMGSNGAFQAIDREGRVLVNDQAKAVSARLSDARVLLDATRWLVLAAGFCAMVAVSLGFARRLKEYR